MSQYFLSRRTVACGIVAVVLTASMSTAAATAQEPIGHYQFGARPASGSVAQTRLTRGGPIHGYFQPVEISGPKGVTISLAEQGVWTDAVAGSVAAGMLIGPVYRFKVSDIEDHPGLDIYPTIEVIDRTYPPPGMERRFPIPVVLNISDLQLVARGLMVTRVIYIEDPSLAIPGAQPPGDQLWHDAGVQANPLEVADRLGRPVAIVRIGGRVPSDGEAPDWEFLYGCPPWRRMPPAPTIVNTPSQPAAKENVARVSDGPEQR